MLVFPFTNDASICLRCQYRLLSRPRLRKKRQILLSPTHFSRSFAFTPCLRQEQFQSEIKARYNEGPPEVSEHKRSISRRSWKSVNLHSKDPLEVEALGKRSEILRMREHHQRPADIVANKMEETNDVPYIMSPSEMLAKMNEERGLVNTRRVAKNIEYIKSSWLSKLQDRLGVPTASEYNDIARALQNGFTKKQLQHYYEVEATDIPISPSSAELSAPFSTDLYTRSPWKLDSTEFPGSAPSELMALREQLKQETITLSKEINEQRAQNFFKNTVLKRVLVDKILRERWNIRTDEEKEMIGEMDIWMHQEHLDLILNHRSNMLKGLAQKYGVKVDAALPHGIIRISGDIGTCGDVFRFLVYTLENISSVDIALSSQQSLHERTLPQGHVSLNQSLRSQIEQLTSTVLRPVPHNEGSAEIHEKLRVYYLGPQQDGLEDVQRLLSQKYPLTHSQREFAIWGGTRNLSQVEPCPLETDQGLPLVERGTQWSRLTAGISRGSKQHCKSKNRLDVKLDQWDETSRSISDLLFTDEQTSKTIIDSDKQSDTFWGDSPILETAAVFGHILYPLESIKKAIQAVSTDQVKIQDTPFSDALASRREFLSTFAGLRVLVSRDLEIKPRKEHSLGKSYQGLRIRLTPSENVDRSAEGKWMFPDLELRFDINEWTKQTTLTDVRLVIERREVDLLLPEEIVDIRFHAESYIPAVSGRFDPQIYDFVQSSNLDIFGQGRLKTPTTLSISIPTHSVRVSSNLPLSDGMRVLKPGPNVMAEYTFCSLEHRSCISNLIGKSELEYTIIEAGKTGGRRIEAQIAIPNSTGKTKREDFYTQFSNIKEIFERFREPTSSRPNESLSKKDTFSSVGP